MREDEAAGQAGMIDNFALALSHGLMMLAAWRLLARPDLDKDAPPPPREPTKQGFGRPGTESRPGA
ncbi:hypothetical protein [Sphingosinicella rhizophila]|uniref:Uncharacterized protein n=1 Tax=Sphingosinicella rhizophila TaxID=3050082 RepID=A0ABU3Q758_9SPHN|nr:hypothetical protein [Sphingosinicella sp. GR2756]MDT9599157.1 hypothetical protein [Sphingosinicella sp. GR2756]